MAPTLRENVRRSIPATVDANGDAVVEFRAPGSINFRVAQVSIEMFTAPAGSTCVLRVNGAFVTFLVETGDAAGGDPPVMLRPNDAMTVEWSGCTPGDQGKATFFYDEVGFGP